MPIRPALVLQAMRHVGQHNIRLYALEKLLNAIEAVIAPTSIATHMDTRSPSFHVLNGSSQILLTLQHNKCGSHIIHKLCYMLSSNKQKPNILNVMNVVICHVVLQQQKDL
jgi:hypothetical protein